MDCQQIAPAFDFEGDLVRPEVAEGRSAAALLSKPNRVVLYVHIPFCNNVCTCCIYNKYATRGTLVEDYLDALEKEIEDYSRRPHIQGSEVISGYVGGGTPAVLSVRQLDRLLAALFGKFKTQRGQLNFTLTVETTPNEMNLEKAKLIRSHGVDRISMGAQSFDETLLKRIGRTHSAERVKRVYHLLRDVGFPYVCVDLMYGLPGQTMQQWEATLDEYLALGADSLGFYPYLVLPDSKLYLDIQNGLVPRTPEQEVLDQMFELGVRKLLSNGYVAVTPNELGKTTIENAENRWGGTDVKMYDVGPPGYRGVVVSTFPLTTHIAHSWYEGGDLLGVGAGAYGYMRDYWYLNEPDVTAYIDRMKKGGLPIVAGSPITADERVARFMVMGTKFLRLLRKDFEGKFGVDMLQVFGPEIRKLEEWGLVEISKEGLQVTYPKGWYYLDNISKAFYTRANYRMPQTTLSNTTILRYLAKPGRRPGRGHALFS